MLSIFKISFLVFYHIYLLIKINEYDLINDLLTYEFSYLFFIQINFFFNQLSLEVLKFSIILLNHFIKFFNFILILKYQ
jgi:hypothetical protein